MRIIDQLNQIGAFTEIKDPATGEIKRKYKMGTKEFFSGSEYPVRVFRLTPEDCFTIHFRDYPFPVRADTAEECFKTMASFRIYHMKQMNRCG